MKKHRGAGHRGGRGNAGTGKRADCKKPSIWGDVNYFGKIGFSSKSRAPDINAINLRTIDEQLDAWVAAGIAKKSGAEYTLDLSAAGFNKLLSTGSLNKKCNITVDFASNGAIEKCKENGCAVTVRFTKKEKTKKTKTQDAPKKTKESSAEESEE
jgi:large subunit ribosomal protein L15